MKKFLSILLVAFVATSVLQAQDNTNYLAKAFELLLDGNIESAERHYAVHKKLTGQTDNDFEVLLQEKKENLKPSWLDECYIIDTDDGYAYAIQKKVYGKTTLDDARNFANQSRVGGFTYWRLPDKDEIVFIFANMGDKFINSTYWTTSTGHWIHNENSEYSLRALGLWEKGTYSVFYNYVYNSGTYSLYAQEYYRIYKGLKSSKDSEHLNKNSFILIIKFKK